MKKLKFRKFLIKRIIIWPIIAILVIALAFVASVLSCQWYADFAALANTNEAALSVQKSECKERAFWSLALSFDDYLTYSMGFSAAAVIVDNETGEVYLDSEYNGVAIIKKNASPTGESIFLLNKSDEFLEVMTQFDPLENVYLDIDNIYVDGNGFYPGEVTVGRLENDWDDIPEKTEVYDFTPENAAELQKYSEGIMSLALGSHPESEVLKTVRTAGKSYETAPLFEFYNTKSVTINGKDYMLRALYRLDYWNLAGKYVLTDGIIFMAICVGIAFLTAYRRYRKYCNQYVIDEHRRNMTNALAHDLKSPLTAIHGYAENLKENIHSEKREYYADAVLENVRYMNEIITNTLDLAKLETGEKGIRKEKVDVTALAEELFEKYSVNIKSRSISVEISGSLTISADKAMMSRAVENLISNAVKFTDDGGKITVCAAEKSLVISNTFTGDIGKKNIESAFGKSDESRSNREGSGLGLSIVKNIASLHKFKLETKAKDGIFTAKISF